MKVKSASGTTRKFGLYECIRQAARRREPSTIRNPWWHTLRRDARSGVAQTDQVAMTGRSSSRCRSRRRGAAAARLGGRLTRRDQRGRARRAGLIQPAQASGKGASTGSPEGSTTPELRAVHPRHALYIACLRGGAAVAWSSAAATSGWRRSSCWPATPRSCWSRRGHPLRELAAEGSIGWERRAYEPGDLEGCLIAIAATRGHRYQHRPVFNDAGGRVMLVNVSRRAPLAFILPHRSSHRPMAVAISTRRRLAVTQPSR